MAKKKNGKAAVILAETKKLKRELTLLPLFGLIYFTVCGGSFGIESLIGYSGPGLALLMILVTPLVFSIPNMLMVREMQSMMPAEGGYYHWIKQAFGPFVGFLSGWMNWVVSWVDVSIYPVLAAYYLSYFIPALNDGAIILGMAVPGWVLSWLVALVLIWAISYLNVRGARLAGLTTDWLGVVMLTPLIIMTGVGIYAWITQGSSFELVFLPHAAPVTMENLIPAFSVGLFVVMWNYMGWELPAAAGDEIVNPKRTYPLAMILVLVAAVATYALPVTASLYGGAGEDERYLVWGMEASDEEAGLVVDVAASEDEAVLTEYSDKMTEWGVDPASDYGWEFPQIAHAIGEKASGQPDGFLAKFLGITVMIAAVLSMIGLFIGNGLGGTRIPFALAEDGMMPRWMVKVHPRYGTPWIAILFCGILFSIFSLQAFAFLVVVDVFLNMVVLCLCFFALWVLRFKSPDRPRKAVPGGWIGLAIVTILPTSIFLFAIYSQIVGVGWSSVGLALIAIVVGAILYFPIRQYIKPGIPDVDPFAAPPEGE